MPERGGLRAWAGFAAPEGDCKRSVSGSDIDGAAAAGRLRARWAARDEVGAGGEHEPLEGLTAAK